MKEHIYRALSLYRRKLRISQHELAARAGLRREKLNRMESKGENIGVEQLCRLLDAAGLELDVREKAKGARSPRDEQALRPPASPGRPAPQPFHRASFVDGSKARVVDWGKLPR